MKQTLKNDILTVEIASHGAELQSITDNKTGHQYLWQGDKAFWGRRSPVLFPIVGAVWDGKYLMDGVEYPLGQHGFARDCEFEVVADGPSDEAWFILKADERTLKLYPRLFSLKIGYRLEGERLTVMWEVENTGDREMAFQIGAHPAFNYPGFDEADGVHGYFMFDRRALTRQTITEKGCVGDGETGIFLDEDGMLPLTSETFEKDALIFAGNQVRRVSLLDKNRVPYLSLLFDAPLVGLWSPSASAPFVCIEPWWGRCDSVGFSGDFTTREYVNTLAPAQTFKASYTIIFENL